MTASDDSKFNSATLKEINRIEQKGNRRSALIGASSVIAAAVLAFTASYIGADKASTTALAVADTARTTEFQKLELQLSGETERSRAEFLRGQRQAPFIQMVRDEILQRRREGAAKTLMTAELTGDLDRTTIDAALDPVRRGLDSMREDRRAIRILGTPAIRQDLKRLYKLHKRQLKILKTAAVDSSRRSGSALLNPDEQRRYTENQNKISPLGREISVLARVAMGNE